MTPTIEQIADSKWWDENTPKGTTHIVHGSCPIKVTGHVVEYFSREEGLWKPNGCELANYAECRLDSRPSPAWNGEGLPPVGVEEMSEQIDWDKAPEGATHWAPAHESFNGVWARLEDGVYKFMCYNGQWLSGAQPLHGEKFIERPQAWSGAGLPPVGVDCEYMKRGTSEWFHCSVIAEHDGGVVVAVHEDDLSYSYWNDSSHFRPIRTHEQIAEDEREAQIVAIHDAIVTSVKVTLGQRDSWRQVAEMVYNAGFKRE